MAADKYHSSREASPYRDTHDRHQSSARSSAHMNDHIDGQIPSRSRGSSATQYNGPPPLHDTINTAVKSADAVNQVPDELVAQITEQVTNSVMSRLKASGMGMSTEGIEVPHQPVPVNPALSRSPTESTASIPRQYTPPSPTARYESMSHRSISPDANISEASSSSFTSNNMSRTERRRSNPSPPRAETARPKPARVPTAIHEATILEKVWQPLFVDGQPTPRLGEFLRGLALHLINDYKPKHSLVVTPAKMSEFFREVAQPNEVYPFPDIFGGRCTNISISRLYQTLRCEHHLVQRGDGDEPTIPSLTPHGFASFMTILIQADPDREYDRLAKAVLHMPISNADLPTERFPKELSRRLFPAEEDRTCAQRLYGAISADRNIALRTSNPIPPPPSQPPPINTAFERERNPYHSTPSAGTSASTSFSTAPPSYAAATNTAFAEDEVRAPQMPIERERQPYTAREGSGKIFKDNFSEQQRPCDNGLPAKPRLNRSNSGAPTVPPQGNNYSSRPVDVPPPNNQRHHRASVTGIRPNFNFANASAAAGVGSNPYTKSEGANISTIPVEYYHSNIHGIDPRESIDDRTKDDPRRYARRGTVDDVAGSNGTAGSHRYSMPPPRTSSQHQYDYSDTREPRELYEDRRRSMYPTNGAPGGTDGYGSFPASRY